MKQRTSSTATTHALQNAWDRLKPFPGGRWLFGQLIAWRVPYTGSIGARIVELERGYAKVLLLDRRKVRNHLHSVHAIALANLGELACGMAMLQGFAPGVRGIVTSFHIDYLKKARGTLIAESRCDIPQVTSDVDFTVTGRIQNQAGEVVATVAVVWRLGLEAPAP